MSATVFGWVFGNIIVALALGCTTWLIGKKCQNPLLLYTLWILVLVKLITPPLVSLPCIPSFDSKAFEQPVNRSTLDGAVDDEAPVIADPMMIQIWKQLTGFARPAEQARSNPEMDQQELADMGSSPSSSSASDSGTPVSSGGQLLRKLPLGFAILLLIWLVGAGIKLCGIILQWRGMRRTLQLCLPQECGSEERLQLLIDQISQQMGIRRVPNVLLVDTAVPPMIWPTRNHATLVIPRALLNTLPQEKIETLIAHELTHIHFLHHWFRRLEILVRVLYWWLPGLKWVSQQIRRYEEDICDANVVRLMPHHAEHYASLLVDTSAFLASFRPTENCFAPGMSSFKQLSQRILMIMNHQSRNRFLWRHWFVLFTLLCILPLSPIAGKVPSTDPPSPAALEQDRKSVQEVDREPDTNDEELRQQRIQNGKHFLDFGIRGVLYSAIRTLRLPREKSEEILTSLKPEIDAAAERVVDKQYAPAALFRHVDPQLESAIWSEVRKHLNEQQAKDLDEHILERKKQNDLTVQLSQESILLLLAQNISLTDVQNEQVARVLSEHWDPSWRGIIFTGADYALITEGAATMLPRELMKPILSKLQFQAFGELQSYAVDTRKILNAIDSGDRDALKRLTSEIRKACIKLLSLRADQIATNCGLTGGQRRRLTVAAKGAGDALADDVERLFESLVDQKTGERPMDPMFDKEMFRFMVEPLIIQCLEQPVWQEAIEKVLTNPQKALLEASIAGWRQREKKRICYYTMLHLNSQQHVLSFETQVAVSEMLVEKVDFSMKGDGMLNLFSSISKLPEEEWKKLIPVDEWPAFSMILKELSKMAPSEEPGN